MKQKVIKKLKELTNHSNVYVVNRGNAAILIAMKLAKKIYPDKKNVLIQDQGGWITYKQYPRKLNLDIIEVKTNYGIIDLDELKDNLNNCCCLIYTNPAGYIAEQPINDIYKLCKGKCLVVMDVSGSIGDKQLCDGRFADVLVGSFGETKVLNCGKGGFISANEYVFETEVDEGLYELIDEGLDRLDDRLKFLYKTRDRIKDELKHFNIIHRDKKGINVIVRFNNLEEKNELIDYCKQNDLEYVICPKYIKVMDDAVSIEVKRLGGR